MLLRAGARGQLRRDRRRAGRRHGNRHRLRRLRVDCDDARRSGLPRPRRWPASAGGGHGRGAVRIVPSASMRRRSDARSISATVSRTRRCSRVTSSMARRTATPRASSRSHVRRPTSRAADLTIRDRPGSRGLRWQPRRGARVGSRQRPVLWPRRRRSGDGARSTIVWAAQGRLFDQIGPVVAGDDDIAQALVSAALAAAGDRPVAVDAFDRIARSRPRSAPAASRRSGRCSECAVPLARRPRATPGSESGAGRRSSSSPFSDLNSRDTRTPPVC